MPDRRVPPPGGGPRSPRFVKPLRAAAEQIRLIRAHCRHTLTLLTAGAPPRYPRRRAAPRRLRRLVAAYARSLRSLAPCKANNPNPANFRNFSSLIAICSLLIKKASCHPTRHFFRPIAKFIIQGTYAFLGSPAALLLTGS